jgi:hypothetical protein
LPAFFEKAYKNAENIQWFHNGNGYLAMFDLGGMKAHASFSKNGYWYYDARFGTETDLPPSVRKQVKWNYVDYTIGKATEVNVAGQKAWVVNVSDINNLVSCPHYGWRPWKNWLVMKRIQKNQTVRPGSWCHNKITHNVKSPGMRDFLNLCYAGLKKFVLHNMGGCNVTPVFRVIN